MSFDVFCKIKENTKICCHEKKKTFLKVWVHEIFMYTVTKLYPASNTCGIVITVIIVIILLINKIIYLGGLHRQRRFSGKPCKEKKAQQLYLTFTV